MCTLWTVNQEQVTSNPHGSSKFIMVDPENLAGTPHLTSSHAAEISKIIKIEFSPGAYDRVVIGAHPGNLSPCRDLSRCIGGSSYFQKGRNGAEEVLLRRFNEIPLGSFGSRFSTCVICSGDRFFVRTAIELRSKGVEVVVMSQERLLSQKLAANADRVIVFSAPLRNHKIYTAS